MNARRTSRRVTAAVAAFTQPTRMAPPAWTAPTVQMSAHSPPHRVAMGGRFSACLPVDTRKDWGGRKELVKRRVALSTFEAEMLISCAGGFGAATHRPVGLARAEITERDQFIRTNPTGCRCGLMRANNFLFALFVTGDHGGTGVVDGTSSSVRLLNISNGSFKIAGGERASCYVG
jgi:hypothetical protein